MPNTIAFLGTGLMGAPMVRRLLGAGHRLRVWNRSADKARALAPEATACATIAEAVEGADVVITMLSGRDALNDVLFGKGGVTTAAQGTLVIDMSSLDPDWATAQHERLTAAGFPHLDAPVSGGVKGAEDGTLAIMVGGAEADFDRARAIFEAMGTPYHIGGPGAGQVSKMVNQTIVHVTIGAVAEGLSLAARKGVDPARVREAISGGFCQSRILELHGARMVERDFVPGGALKFSIKDLTAAAHHAEAAGLDLPLTGSTLAGYRHLLESGHGDLDHAALLLAYEEDI